MKVHGLAAVLALMLGAIGCSKTNHFLYAVGPRTNSVIGFRESPDGVLTALSSGFTTDAEPVAVVVHPSGLFAFSANFAGGNVSAFTKDNTGTLKQATDPITSVLLGPFTTGTNPISMALNPSGQFLYVLNQGTTPVPNTPDVQASIAVFSVDNTSGNLTGLPASLCDATITNTIDNITTTTCLFFTPANTTSLPVSMAMAANGQFLYIVDAAQATVAGFVIGSNGSLTAVPGSPFSVGSSPSFVAVDPEVKFLYVSDVNANGIFAFTIDQSTGALSPVSGSPFAAGTTPVSLAVDATGVFLVAANKGSNNISAYSINTGTGALSQVSGSPFATGTTPVFVTIDITNSFVYVADNVSDDITAFALTGGTLKSVLASPFNIADSPVWLTSH